MCFCSLTSDVAVDIVPLVFELWQKYKFILSRITSYEWVATDSKWTLHIGAAAMPAFVFLIYILVAFSRDAGGTCLRHIRPYTCIYTSYITVQFLHWQGKFFRISNLIHLYSMQMRCFWLFLRHLHAKKETCSCAQTQVKFLDDDLPDVFWFMRSIIFFLGKPF